LLSGRRLAAENLAASRRFAPPAPLLAGPPAPPPRIAPETWRDVG
jgi:hypothetical protein